MKMLIRITLLSLVAGLFVSSHLSAQQAYQDHFADMQGGTQRIFQSNQACMVWIGDRGRLNLYTRDPNYQNRGVWFEEGIQIWKNKKGAPLIKSDHVLTEKDGKQTRSNNDGYELFLTRCQMMANRDLPLDIKAKFYGFLGVR